MAKSPELQTSKRAQIEVLFKQGYSKKHIARIMKVPPITVRRTLNRISETRSYGSRPRSGRPKVTSSRDDSMIVRQAKYQPTASANKVRSEVFSTATAGPSARTVRRRLVCAGLKSYKAAKKPKLSAKNIRDRMTFCKRYANWTEEMWAGVMFSDEVSLAQFGSFSTRVRRPPNKRYNPRYVLPTVKNPPKVMVWGAISASGRCGLWFMPPKTTINGAVYLEILKEKLELYMGIQKLTHFQQDGAPCHRTKAVTDWLRERKIAVVGPWPGNSPDLNPIENCWWKLKKEVHMKHPRSLEDLKVKIKQVWCENITPDYCMKLVNSMPGRIAGVLKSKGGHTKY